MEKTREERKEIEFKPIVGLAMERCIPYADDTFWNLIGLAQLGVPFIRTQTAPIDTVCNKFGKHILETDFTHLIILGIDHVHPIDLVHRFQKHIKEYPDHLVVGALNFRRGQPYDPLAFVYDNGDIYSIAEWEEGEIIKIDALGTNELCIHRSIFEILEYPWFYRDYSVNENGMSEDLVFCRALREAGIDIWLDTSITNDHLINGRINETVFRSYLDHVKEVKENGGNQET